ncbi:hypothetical protein C476_09203 [Natrinema limicola JCM 13563]|uniref:Uncharacterized protein n=1 Tax=Natrinema limicola JCM 13563 TaxID=1230457 RepID=M0CHH4_9EURY|nr:hypothetical protein C476_09203 [Natrinema limicola JCM 13563]
MYLSTPISVSRVLAGSPEPVRSTLADRSRYRLMRSESPIVYGGVSRDTAVDIRRIEPVRPDI